MRRCHFCEERAVEPSGDFLVCPLHAARDRIKSLIRATEDYAYELEEGGALEEAAFHHARSIGLSHALSVMVGARM